MCAEFRRLSLQDLVDLVALANEKRHDLEETARMLGVSERTVQRLHRSGELAFRRIANKPMCSDRDIAEYLEKVRHPKTRIA